MYQAKKKTIYILLTKYSDRISRTIGVCSGCKYMHASIGLEDGRTFFSFNTKHGFCIETPLSKSRQTPCMLYTIDVPEHTYQDIARRIQVFIDSESRYRFSYIGTVCCILRLPSWCIPAQNKNRYFCSQFVSELLCLTGAAQLRKPPSRFLPKDFSTDPQFSLRYQGALMGIAGVI